jgi:hypothetical protein
MAQQLTLQSLWDSIKPGDRLLETAHISRHPEAVRRYLSHAITPGTKLSKAVWLRMHGEIKLKGWLPFKAEQVINAERGMIWKASVKMKGLTISGFDRIIDGEGVMRWKLLGIFPILKASGPDVSKSAGGRLAAETAWLPSMFCEESVSWVSPGSSHIEAGLTIQGTPSKLSLTIGQTGGLESFIMQRWGNPGNPEFRYEDFGGVVEEEGTFGGYTIPVRMRIGWYYGTERFESEGEFFRVKVDNAIFK